MQIICVNRVTFDRKNNPLLEPLDTKKKERERENTLGIGVSLMTTISKDSPKYVCVDFPLATTRQETVYGTLRAHYLYSQKETANVISLEYIQINTKHEHF